jgi:hypothetical protein
MLRRTALKIINRIPCCIEEMAFPLALRDLPKSIGHRPASPVHSPLLVMKKFFQNHGSFLAVRLSSLEIPNATSGFRAMSRKTADR